MSLGNVLIIGDSYSTFEGQMPEGFPSYYPALDVTKVQQTWWKQLLDCTQSKLLLNSSWTGTTICNTGYHGEDYSAVSFIARVDKLISTGFLKENLPDTCLVFGGTNDSCAGVPLGTLKYEDWHQKDLFEALPAVCYLLDRLQNALPKARLVVIVNTDLNPDLYEGLLSACAHYEVEAVVLYDISKQNGHPDQKGMCQIKEQILQKLHR